jgi:hypothetical protein
MKVAKADSGLAVLVFMLCVVALVQFAKILFPSI